MRWVRPDEEAPTVHDVDYRGLARRGRGALLFDLDNTLGLWRRGALDRRVRELLRGLQGGGFRLAVLSNARLPPDAPVVQELQRLGIPVVAPARKPFKRGFRRALRLLGAEPFEAAVIGDQLLTDVLGGRRMGLYTVLVEPLGPEESRLTKVNRALERLLGRRPICSAAAKSSKHGKG
ncbi:MAG: YqeG family HAD IIIA-type phosphatase [Candidatus Acetothermia bacterium]|nr:YqeG family HAD IIIA-type phosphatase [Candidatus Acetothermia bacterium]